MDKIVGIWISERWDGSFMSPLVVEVHRRLHIRNYEFPTQASIRRVLDVMQKIADEMYQEQSNEHLEKETP